MPAPPGLSTKKRSAQRRPSRRHCVSTSSSPWASTTGDRTISTLAKSASPSPAIRPIAAHSSALASSCSSPAESTQPSPRGSAAHLEERAMPQLEPPIQPSPRHARRLRLLGHASARTASIENKKVGGAHFVKTLAHVAITRKDGVSPHGLHGLYDPGGLDHLPLGNPLVHSCRAISDLHNPFLDERIAHRPADRDAQEVRVLELDPRPLVTIVHEDVEARLDKSPLDILGRRHLRGVLHGDRDEMDVEGRDGPGPDDAVRIVALLDGGRGDACGTYAVGAHDDGFLLPRLVQVHGVEPLRVLGSELEDIAHLDDALDLQGLATSGTALAGQGHLEIGPVAAEVLAGSHPDEMEPVTVGAHDISPGLE